MTTPAEAVEQIRKIQAQKVGDVYPHFGSDIFAFLAKQHERIAEVLASVEDHSLRPVSETWATGEDFDEWHAQGMNAGWVGPGICITHDGYPTSEEEDDVEDDGCWHVMRLYPDLATKAAVEENHSPSVWRKP